MRALALGTAVLAACWNAPPPSTPAVRDAPPPDASVVVPLPPHTVWTGRYECAQGVTSVQLTLDVEPDGRARAIFDFGPLADNPTVPSGSYRMRGTVAPLDSALDLWLKPDEWIDRPESYEMVGLHAGIDAARRGLRGRILNDYCDWLDAKRSD